MSADPIVQLLARGYTREQIAAWQAAVAEQDTDQADAAEPAEPEEDKKPRSAGRRRNT